MFDSWLQFLALIPGLGTFHFLGSIPVLRPGSIPRSETFIFTSEIFDNPKALFLAALELRFH